MSRPSGRRASIWVTIGSAPRARRIEIGVEHADRAEELELARGAFAHVEIGRAEQGDQGAGALAHHAFEAGRRVGRRGGGGATGGATRGARAARRDAAGGERAPPSSPPIMPRPLIARRESRNAAGGKPGRRAPATARRKRTLFV